MHNKGVDALSDRQLIAISAVFVVLVPSGDFSMQISDRNSGFLCGESYQQTVQEVCAPSLWTFFD